MEYTKPKKRKQIGGGVTIETDKQLPEREGNDFYPTPFAYTVPAVARLLYRVFKGREPETILDPSAGDGGFGQAAKLVYPRARLVGIDIRNIPKPFGYDEWYSGEDFMAWSMAQWGRKFDVIVTNPPYFIAEHFIQRGYDMLETGGVLGYLFRLNLVAGLDRYQRFYSGDMKPRKVIAAVNRISFSGDGNTNATEYAMFQWVKGWSGQTGLEWLKWR